MGNRISLRHALGLGVALAAAAGLTGCGNIPGITDNTHTSVYDNLAAMQEAKLPVPDLSWMPEDATSIRVKYDGSEGALLMYHTSMGPEAGCAETTPDRHPRINDTWWPLALPETVKSCGDWVTYTGQGVVYADTTSH